MHQRARAGTVRRAASGRKRHRLQVMVLLSVLILTQVVKQHVTTSKTALHLTLKPDSAPTLSQGSNFWTAAPRGFNNAEALDPPLLTDLQRQGVTTLLDWNGHYGATRTQPLVDTTSTIRILGGWQVSARCSAARPIPGCIPSPDTPLCCDANGTRVSCCPAPDWGDIVLRQPSGSLVYRWQLLWQRLDPQVNNSIIPMFVLDNVDYAFVKDANIGTYGQSKAPDNPLEYGVFISDLVRRCIDRYGIGTVSKFWWRVATEPNTGRGGVGEEIAAPDALKISTYVNYYLAVEQAIRHVLPTAIVGPGNFASWWQKGIACNRTTGAHANEGLNIIRPMLAGILARNGSVGFLAMSFYGSDAGNEVGSDTACNRFSGCGYDPRQAMVAGEGLVYLRGLFPQLATTPLQVHEYAPSAYGGAWTLASSVQFAAQGIDRVFHWDINEHQPLTPHGDNLFYANAFVMAAARKLFGVSPTANVSVLAADGVTGTHVGRVPALAMLENAETTTGTPSCNATTSASGIGGMLVLSNSTTYQGAGKSGSGIGFLISVFNRRKDCTNETTVQVRFRCPTTGACGPSMGTSGTVRLMVLNHTTSVYGQILQDARRHRGWLSYGDDEIYPLRGPYSSLLTATGLAGVKDNARYWLAQQSRLFTPRISSNSDGVHVHCSGDACTVTLVASPPSVHALFIDLV